MMMLGKTDSKKRQPSARKMNSKTMSKSVSAVSGTTSGQNGKKTIRNKKRVNCSRLLFLLCLALIAAIMAYTGYRLLTDTERRLASVQFAAFGESALNSAQLIAARQKRALWSLSTVISETLHDATKWPLVHLTGFRNIANSIIAASSDGTKHVHMTFLPIVTPETKDAYLDYAFHTAMNGNASGNVADGKEKLWSMVGNGTWGSPNDIFTPMFQHSHIDALFNMDWHAVEARGRLVDEMIACSKERAVEMAADATAEPRDCSLVTDIVDLKFKTPVERPAAVLVSPIYPADAPTNMTGLVTSTVVWDHTLRNVFSSEVSGVDVVLSSTTQTFTYEITHGQAYLKGLGDLHDSTYDQYAQEVVLMSNDYSLTLESPTYTLTAYPNEALFHIYETNNNLVACIGTIAIIFFTSILFFLYDFFVRSEFRHKDTMSAARRQFVRFISHEVRTPLNAVCMGLQLLKDEMTTSQAKGSSPESGKSSGDVQKQLQEELRRKYVELSDLQDDMMTSAHSAVGILNDLLNYDKVESGTLQLELSVLNMYGLMEQTVAEFRQAAKLKKIQFDIDYRTLSPDEPIAGFAQLPQDILNRRPVGDSARLCQVLRNLISNALKFTPAGGTVTIRPVVLMQPELKTQSSDITLNSGETSTFTHGGLLQLHVQDTGAGMTPDQLKQLFREGVQFDVNKLQAGGGSGLGLYIAKGMLEQHGGSLTVWSAGKDKGTTFTMSLPLYYVDTTIISEVGHPDRTLRWDKLDPLNVLVVDDSNMNRKLLLRLLRNHGHVCEEAENGKMAIDRVVEKMKGGRRFDAILMDNEMPVMNGSAAASTLRSMGCDSFLVGITGTLFWDDVEHFKECGANVVLPKPLDLHDLMDVLVENGVADCANSAELSLPMTADNGAADSANSTLLPIPMMVDSGADECAISGSTDMTVPIDV